MDVAQDIVGTAVGESADHVAHRVTEHYERRGRELWGLARRLGATDEGAADVVQEAHLRLWRELSNGTFVEDVDAWVFRVAYRLVMDQHRLGRRVRPHPGIHGRSDDYGTRMCERGFGQEVVRQAVSQAGQGVGSEWGHDEQIRLPQMGIWVIAGRRARKREERLSRDEPLCAFREDRVHVVAGSHE